MYRKLEKPVSGFEAFPRTYLRTSDRGEHSPPVQFAGSGDGAAAEGVYDDLETAIKLASEAQKQLMSLTLAKRREIIESLRLAGKANAEFLAAATVKETGLGRCQDKVKKLTLVAEKTPGPEILQPEAFTGDHGLSLLERAPYGVVASITPVTNPVETVLNNAIGMLAAGNAVVFNAHPSAMNTTNQAISVFNRAIVQAGGLPNLLTSVKEPTISTAQQLMKHPIINLVVVTGGMAVVRAALGSGKKVIAAGPGNPPVIVDETADLEKAAADIVSGASFDNNIICICEKELIVVDKVADNLKAYLKKHGGYEAGKWLTKRLENLLLTENNGPGRAGVPNKAYIGKDAHVILGEVGCEASSDLRLIFMEVDPDHPFVWSELMMPVMPLVRVKDADAAIALAVRAEQRFGHSAVMHSLNLAKLSEMARLVNTAIFTKNGPSYAGLGFGGEGYTSFTIATTTGEGLTNARHFTRERRCALVDHFRII